MNAPKITPAIDCAIECCCRTTLAQMTAIQIKTTGIANIPNTRINAVPGPPTPAPCTDTLDFKFTTVTPNDTVKYAAASELMIMHPKRV